MNVPRPQLDRIVGILPALATPTVSTLADRALAPVLHGMLTRGNEKAMQRLAEQLA